MPEVEEYLITSGWDKVVMTLTRISSVPAVVTDADRALLAVQGPFPPCPSCKAPSGSRCHTPTGSLLTTPHQRRLDMATGYIARQPEVDALKAAADEWSAQVEAPNG